MGIRTLPSLGSVTKKEKLAVASHLRDVNSLVLETIHPYAGYYGTTVPDRNSAMSLFLVTRHHYNDDKVIRYIQNVKKTFSRNFDAVPGVITAGNKSYPVIRVRYFPVEYVSVLISAFREHGAEFLPAIKVSPFDGLIRITKYFNTEEVEEGIFFDIDNSAFAYIQVDEHLRWPTFESVTSHVRNNTGNISFDAAQATMYDCAGIIELVRIYDEKRSLDSLRNIRNKYIQSIQKSYDSSMIFQH